MKSSKTKVSYVRQPCFIVVIIKKVSTLYVPFGTLFSIMQTEDDILFLVEIYRI